MSGSHGRETNYVLFRDYLSTTLVQAEAANSVAVASNSGSSKKRRRAAGGASARDAERDASELADFIDYVATEIFDSLSLDLQGLDYRSWRDSTRLQSQFSPPLTADSLSSALNLPPSINDTLQAYNLISPDPTLDSPLPSSTEAFLIPVLSAYVGQLSTPPPSTAATRTEACELCGRWWVPLSYHHLIPRFVHEKTIRRGWHRKEDLQNVAWLCGACHRFVHHFRGHEDLARDFYTVELLLADDEVQKWAGWVGKLRWKGGNTGSRR